MDLRISLGTFEPSAALRRNGPAAGIGTGTAAGGRGVAGCRSFTGGIDTRQSYFTNTSMWYSFEAADQMRTLPAMLALRAEFDALGVQFIPITNHNLLWRTDTGAAPGPE